MLSQLVSNGKITVQFGLSNQRSEKHLRTSNLFFQIQKTINLQSPPWWKLKKNREVGAMAAIAWRFPRRRPTLTWVACRFVHLWKAKYGDCSSWLLIHLKIPQITETFRDTFSITSKPLHSRSSLKLYSIVRIQYRSALKISIDHQYGKEGCLEVNWTRY